MASLALILVVLIGSGLMIFYQQQQKAPTPTPAITVTLSPLSADEMAELAKVDQALLQRLTQLNSVKKAIET